MLGGNVAGTSSNKTDHPHHNRESVKKVKNFVVNHGGAALVSFIAGLVLLVAAVLDVRNMNERNTSQNERTGYRFGIAVAVIGMVLSALYILITRSSKAGHHSLRLVISFLLMAIWGVGAFWLTFGAAYDETGNAFFALWIGFMFSLFLFTTETSVSFKQVNAVGWEVAALFLFSVTLAVACISFCMDVDYCKEEQLFGLITGIISAVFCLFVFMFVSRISYKVTAVLSVLMFALWLATAFVLTFRRPFEVTGNGYFSCWGGVISIALLTARTLDGAGVVTAHEESMA